MCDLKAGTPGMQSQRVARFRHHELKDCHAWHGWHIAKKGLGDSACTTNPLPQAGAARGGKRKTDIYIAKSETFPRSC